MQLWRGEGDIGAKTQPGGRGDLDLGTACPGQRGPISLCRGPNVQVLGPDLSDGAHEQVVGCSSDLRVRRGRGGSQEQEGEPHRAGLPRCVKTLALTLGRIRGQLVQDDLWPGCILKGQLLVAVGRWGWPGWS